MVSRPSQHSCCPLPFPFGGGQSVQSDQRAKQKQRQDQLCRGSGALGFRRPWVQIPALPVPTATSNWASDASSVKWGEGVPLTGVVCQRPAGTHTQ